ncbi:(5-formylfuran-3-yl)methyl phosphate synthase [Stieleria sp. TO1_6]|uniref:(5-formylfuran-3-yl)methyl phosphate synthase n=1 Tax=Stieleria tagensis TaxID=2956795 RepID=UPI00209B9EA2|nr:(5-formylfuran-3-yl)methyl phosphate synthase [Stieleria tagensis]MCO8122064.1 (5-formylfuran-3-yl)methyl phosphate synthase [Stieleria tagensis]
MDSLSALKRAGGRQQSLAVTGHSDLPQACYNSNRRELQRPSDMTLIDRPAPEWLVSVRDLNEAELAVQFGVSILDFKEPSAGALAAVGPAIWRAASHRVRQLVHPGDQQPAGPSGPQPARPLRLSAALGELPTAAALAAQLPSEFEFAKAGPAGCSGEAELLGHWRAVGMQLPPSVQLVAVAYADHQHAGCLPVETILRIAIDAGFQRFLIDTSGKTGPTSIQILGPDRLRALGRLAHQNSIWWSLAGSIKLSQRQHLDGIFKHGSDQQRAHGPDCIAVRGDVCRSDRTGTLCPDRLRAWRSSGWVKPNPSLSFSATALQSSRSSRPPTPIPISAAIRSRRSD